MDCVISYFQYREALYYLLGKKERKTERITFYHLVFTYLLFSSMTWFALCAADLLWRCFSISVTLWLTLLLVFFLAPAVPGVSLSLHRHYVATLLNIFEVWSLSVADLKVVTALFSLHYPSHSFVFKLVGIPTDENDGPEEESAAVQTMARW